MALVARALSAKIELAAGATFNEGGGNVVELSGMRMSAELVHAGGLSDGTLDLTIWGMERSTMNQLSTLGMQVNLVPKNAITLLAGEEGGAMSTAFIGYIIAAYADYNASPEVSFHITAHTLVPFATIPAEASSFRGTVDVATIMAGFATKMGLRFENSGVQTKLSNPYFPGSTKTQAQSCITQAGISWNNGALGVLAIWPKGGSRGGQVPVIAPPPVGAMIGFPTYTAYGIMVRNLYDPTIGYGQKIQVQSSVLNTGEWAVYGLDHHLECQVVNGKWESTILAYNPKHPTPVR